MPRNENKSRTGKFNDYLLEALKDPEMAKEYLDAALADGDHRVFLLALRNVVQAIGVTELARMTGLARKSIYRMTSDEGNPTISSVADILRAMGLRIRLQADPVLGPSKELSVFYLDGSYYQA